MSPKTKRQALCTPALTWLQQQIPSNPKEPIDCGWMILKDNIFSSKQHMSEKLTSNSSVHCLFISPMHLPAIGPIVAMKWWSQRVDVSTPNTNSPTIVVPIEANYLIEASPFFLQLISVKIMRYFLSTVSQKPVTDVDYCINEHYYWDLVPAQYKQLVWARC